MDPIHESCTVHARFETNDTVHKSHTRIMAQFMQDSVNELGEREMEGRYIKRVCINIRLSVSDLFVLRGDLRGLMQCTHH